MPGQRELLLLIVGLFGITVSVICVMHLRKDRIPNRMAYIWAAVLFLAGVLTAVYPWLVSAKSHELFSETVGPSYLRGDELFHRQRPMNESNHQDASIWYARGVALYRAERLGFDSTDVAMGYFDKSIRSFETAEAYTARGQLKVQLSDMNGALLDYDRAIAIDAFFGRAYFNRGTLHYIMGNIDLACEDWSQAKKMNVLNSAEIIAQMCQ